MTIPRRGRPLLLLFLLVNGGLMAAFFVGHAVAQPAKTPVAD